jgi:Fe/S biogenesis protein NfuA
MKILAAEINPYVASHGGEINFEDFVDGYVHVRMSGGCQGCGQATATLKQGVEKALKDAFGDKIKGVVDVTDHSQGSNPFYTPSK